MENSTTYYIVLISFLMPLILSTILIWFVINYQRRKNLYEIESRERKLQEQALIIKNQEALQKERNRIASEMHDDLGSGLTTIKFISQRAARNIKSIEDKVVLDKIIKQSTELVENMSEIIWAMNSRFDNLTSTLAYIRRYSNEYLSQHQIEFIYTHDGLEETFKFSGEQRRHLLLAIKEILHNVVKHAQATQVNLNVILEDQVVNMKIKDNGLGISESSIQTGNGLRNIRDRVKELKGDISIINKNGLEYNIQFNIKNTSS